MKNKKSLLLLIVLAVVVIGTVGLTYALYSRTIIGNNTELVAGDIYMHYNETKEVTISNAMPSATYSEDQPAFEFNITGKNTNSDNDIWYEIVLTHGDVPDGKQEENMTLGEMASGKNPSFKIKIGKNNETVTLVGNGGEPKKEYTFTFESDIAVVKNENNLNEALNNDKIKTIIVGENFNVKDSVTINRDIKISSLESSVFTITSEHSLKEHDEEKESGEVSDIVAVFDVKSNSNVTFENLKIKNNACWLGIVKPATKETLIEE